MANAKVAFTWPSGLGFENLPFGPSLVGELERLLRRTKQRIDILFYNINSSQEFVLSKTIHDLMVERDIELNIFCDKRSEGKRIIDTFQTQFSIPKGWYWNDQENAMSKFHIKAIIVDQRHIYLGSANMSQVAMKSSAECGLFLSSTEISQQLLQYVELLIENKYLVLI